MTIDPTVTVVAIFGAVTWLLGISFSLGKYSERLRRSEIRADKMEHTTELIYDRLESLTKMLPHVCMQAERLTRVEAKVETLTTLE